MPNRDQVAGPLFQMQRSRCTISASRRLARASGKPGPGAADPCCARPGAAGAHAGDGRLSQPPRPHVFCSAPGGSPYYRVEWALYPNLAMDLIVPQLAQVYRRRDRLAGFPARGARSWSSAAPWRSNMPSSAGSGFPALPPSCSFIACLSPGASSTSKWRSASPCGGSPPCWRSQSGPGRCGWRSTRCSWRRCSRRISSLSASMAPCWACMNCGGPGNATRPCRQRRCGCSCSPRRPLPCLRSWS